RDGSSQTSPNHPTSSDAATEAELLPLTLADLAGPPLATGLASGGSSVAGLDDSPQCNLSAAAAAQTLRQLMSRVLASQTALRIALADEDAAVSEVVDKDDEPTVQQFSAANNNGTANLEGDTGESNLQRQVADVRSAARLLCRQLAVLFGERSPPSVASSSDSDNKRSHRKVNLLAINASVQTLSFERLPEVQQLLEELARQRSRVEQFTDAVESRADALAKERVQPLARELAKSLAKEQAEVLAVQRAEALARQWCESMAKDRAEIIARGRAEVLAESIVADRAESIAKRRAEVLAREKAEVIARDRLAVLTRGMNDTLAREKAEFMQRAESLCLLNKERKFLLNKERKCSLMRKRKFLLNKERKCSPMRKRKCLLNKERNCLLSKEWKCLPTRKRKFLLNKERKCLPMRKRKFLLNKERKCLPMRKRKFLLSKERKCLPMRKRKFLLSKERKCLPMRKRKFLPTKSGMLANEKAEVLAQQRAEVLANEKAEVLAQQRAEVLANERVDSLARDRIEALAKEMLASFNRSKSSSNSPPPVTDNPQQRSSPEADSSTDRHRVERQARRLRSELDTWRGLAERWKLEAAQSDDARAAAQAQLDSLRAASEQLRRQAAVASSASKDPDASAAVKAENERLKSELVAAAADALSSREEAHRLHAKLAAVSEQCEALRLQLERFDSATPARLLSAIEQLNHRLAGIAQAADAFEAAAAQAAESPVASSPRCAAAAKTAAGIGKLISREQSRPPPTRPRHVSIEPLRRPSPMSSPMSRDSGLSPSGIGLPPSAAAAGVEMYTGGDDTSCSSSLSSSSGTSTSSGSYYFSQSPLAPVLVESSTAASPSNSGASVALARLRAGLTAAVVDTDRLVRRLRCIDEATDRKISGDNNKNNKRTAVDATGSNKVTIGSQTANQYEASHRNQKQQQQKPHHHQPSNCRSADFYRLSCVGRLEDLELLKRQNRECCAELNSALLRIDNRLRHYASQSVLHRAQSADYNLLRSLRRELAALQCYSEQRKAMLD
uniref:Centrosomal protein of 162 kDa n=1 Tax=Macrostomum lignano TaxID=282301 RepID=A0A1I8GYW1_9PLAT